MAVFIQSFGKGHIARDGDKYQYVENNKVVGTYDTTEALVEAYSGKQTKQSGSSSSQALTTADVAPKAAAKKSAKKAS